MRSLLLVFSFVLSLFTAQVSAAADAAKIDMAKLKKVLASDDVSALDAFISAGLDVNIRDEYGDTLLLYALNNNQNLVMARQLVIAGADLNAPSKTTGETPLIVATSMASNLQQQVNALYKNKEALVTDTTLQSAVLAQMNRALEIAKMLIEAGADVNQETPYGTPLMDAAKNEWNNSIIDLLLENGAKVNQTDRLGRTALFYASAFDCNKIISRLLSAGGDIQMKDIDGKSYMEAKPKDFVVE
ncbi:MAG: ankyrin repeat domain-containing protein [Alphaproteobacteria bacterium]|nr:ankyrin repeat domain-containing protein [Alphaproteobacteria bacterium]